MSTPVMARPAPPRPAGATGPAAALRPGRVIIGIGEFAIGGLEASIVTHALGSCVAVCIWDATAGIGGLLHFLLPDSKINPDRARQQPGTFADTGIPLLFQSAYARGLEKARSRVCLVGGAEVAGLAGAGSFNVGKRNLLAARQLLWRNGVLIHAEAAGGTAPRNVTLQVNDGSVEVSAGPGAVLRL
jgi:chemotaxis protein CheD